MSYEFISFDVTVSKHVLMGKRIFRKLKSIFHHFILELILLFNSKSDHFRIYDFKHNSGGGVMVVSFHFAIKEGLDIDEVLNKLKEKRAQ